MGGEVLHMTSALADAVARGDATAAASLYADDGRLLTAAELLTGRGEIEAFWRAGIALGLARIELDPIELRVADRVAIEIGRYAFSLDCGGAPAERGKYLALHRREPDGGWRRIVDVFNPSLG